MTGVKMKRQKKYVVVVVVVAVSCCFAESFVAPVYCLVTYRRQQIFLFALFLRLLHPPSTLFVFQRVFLHVTIVPLIGQQLCVSLTLFFCTIRKTTHD